MSLLKTIKSYTRNQTTAGAKGLEHVVSCIDHMFAHGDSTPLCFLVGTLEARDSAAIRKIVGVCVGGIKLKKDATQASGLKITQGDNAGPTEKMDTLRALVEQSVSFRSSLIAESLFDDDSGTTSFDKDKYAKTVASKIHKAMSDGTPELSIDVMMSAIREAYRLKVAESGEPIRSTAPVVEGEPAH